jgi:hypothetical protein
LSQIFVMPEPESFEIKDNYHVDDFFKYHGMEFDGISTILMSCLSIGAPRWECAWFQSSGR